MPRAEGSPAEGQAERSAFPPARRAATLLLLYPRVTPDATRELVIPLTVRHANLREHAGEVSLPGGAIDPSDPTPADAALREAWEELGVPPADVRVLGQLDATWIPVSNFELRPFVGALPSAPDLVAHEPEVEAIIELPARLLLEEGRLVEEVISGPGWQRLAGGYRHGEHLIWGATARSLAMFATVLRLAGELT